MKGTVVHVGVLSSWAYVAVKISICFVLKAGEGLEARVQPSPHPCDLCFLILHSQTHGWNST